VVLVRVFNILSSLPRSDAFARRSAPWLLDAMLCKVQWINAWKLS